MGNRSIWICAIALAVGLGTAPVSAENKVEKPKLLSSQARVSMKRAEKTALAKAPGRATEIELEIKDGQLIYSVEIEQDAGKEVEVKIDAKSGKVIKVEGEANAKEAK